MCVCTVCECECECVCLVSGLAVQPVRSTMFSYGYLGTKHDCRLAKSISFPSPGLGSELSLSVFFFLLFFSPSLVFPSSPFLALSVSSPPSKTQCS
ncbi:hypothetical protein LX36DRAFT_285406 [Colletotrichum falcatum]|nr:hypothetical protein LX36DRAFT_285406 [Colletotrichum falcatum]